MVEEDLKRIHSKGWAEMIRKVDKVTLTFITAFDIATMMALYFLAGWEGGFGAESGDSMAAGALGFALRSTSASKARPLTRREKRKYLRVLRAR